MKKEFYSRPVKFLRLIARAFTRRYRVCPAEKLDKPAVYIVHHQNLFGPIFTIIWISTNMHMWVLSPFCNQETCYNHYVNYTFTKRFGMNRKLASIIVHPISFLVSKLLQSLRVIPVFRGSRDIITTIRQSISALEAGESILICPDINYKDSGPEMGEMYDGFLNLDKYYNHKTNMHIPFVPLHINKSSRYIYVGNEIYFNTNCDYRKEKVEVYERLKKEFHRLEHISNEKKSAV